MEDTMLQSNHDYAADLHINAAHAHIRDCRVQARTEGERSNCRCHRIASLPPQLRAAHGVRYSRNSKCDSYPSRAEGNSELNSIVKELADSLLAWAPDLKGFSSSNLWRMR